ncbi:MAG: FadR/GntR family transcriptional regulator [Thermodesulfobacteriota bacterium]
MIKYPDFKPLKKSRLFEQVADQIKQSIYEGELAPGNRLPSERELCQIFKVGRPTIREALRTLSVMGLVEINRGTKGATVSKANISQYIETMSEQLSWLIRADKKTLEELWEVRKYIELGIVQAAARNATGADLKKLQGLVKKMEDCGGNFELYFPLAIEFHRKIARATKNKMFFLFWEICQGIMLEGYIPILREIFPEGPDKLRQANKILLKAIKSKDPATIDRAMEFHAQSEAFFDFTPKFPSG